MIAVAPERLDGWLQRFAADHGALVWAIDGAMAVARAADGTVVQCAIPFPPLDQADVLVSHALRARTIGVLLVRLGGFAAGVFAGGTLVGSKCGSRLVHGRSAAGGQSQQRFARRRENQARAALDAAVAAAVAVLLPVRETLDGIVVGGDRHAVDTVMGDPALAPLRALVTGRLLDVPDPRRKVLVEAGAMARLVHVRIVEVA